MVAKYRLADHLATEYELNRGPVPSGYAYIEIQLHPQEGDGFEFSTPDDLKAIWQLPRKLEEWRRGNKSEYEDAVISFMPIIRQGILEGVAEAMAESLDKPVVGVRVEISRIAIDPEFSTKMSFHLAAKAATEKLLIVAKERGMLVQSDLD
jgi:hypothetical protein